MVVLRSSILLLLPFTFAAAAAATTTGGVQSQQTTEYIHLFNPCLLFLEYYYLHVSFGRGEGNHDMQEKIVCVVGRLLHMVSVRGQCFCFPRRTWSTCFHATCNLQVSKTALCGPETSKYCAKMERSHLKCRDERHLKIKSLVNIWILSEFIAQWPKPADFYGRSTMDSGEWTHTNSKRNDA